MMLLIEFFVTSSKIAAFPCNLDFPKSISLCTRNRPGSNPKDFAIVFRIGLEILSARCPNFMKRAGKKEPMVRSTDSTVFSTASGMTLLMSILDIIPIGFATIAFIISEFGSSMDKIIPTLPVFFMTFSPNPFFT